MPSLRFEANPKPWGELNQEQKKAFEAIVRMMGEAVDSVSKGTSRALRDETKVPWIRYDRRSATAFLSGVRGSGKTTVYASLVAATTSTESQFDFAAPENLFKPLAKLRRRIVWLEPIDLEPCPTSLSPLTALLARIDAAVASYGIGVPSPGSRRDMIEPVGELQEVFAQLERLKTNAAIGWDGNLSDISGQMSPEIYAAEVLRTESSRLSLSQSMAAVLDGLAKHAFESRAGLEDPIFVLPIDDFDLAPTLCLKILRLMRMLWVKRLFFLVLGDVNVAETVIYLGLAGEFGHLTERIRHLDLIPIAGDEAAGVAAEVAANALRKLVPPSQRIVLEDMSVSEALEYRGDVGLPSLSELLRKVSLEVGGRKTVPVVKDLQTLIVGQPPPVRTWRGSRVLHDTRYWGYTARGFLQTTPRRIADLWLNLNDRLRGGGGLALEEAIDILGEQCQTLISEDPAFSRESERIALAELTQNDAGEWELGVPPLKATPVTDSGQTIYSEPNDHSNGVLEMSVRIHRGKGWCFEQTDTLPPQPISRDQMGQAAAPRDSPARMRRVLGRETGAALMIYHDLLVLGPDRQNFRSPFLQNSPDLTPWAVTVWSSASKEYPVCWPAPPFSTFWEYNEFLSAWNEVVLDLAKEGELSKERRFEFAVYAWIGIGTTVLLGRQPMQSVIPEVDWAELAKDLRRLSRSGDRKCQLWRLSVQAMIDGEEYGAAFLGTPFKQLDSGNKPAGPQVQMFRRQRVRHLDADIIGVLQRMNKTVTPEKTTQSEKPQEEP